MQQKQNKKEKKVDYLGNLLFSCYICHMITYYLYLKESPLGLKYLGMTTRNPYKYKGSGKYWVRHLKSHNFSLIDIKTLILFESNNKLEVDTFALKFSVENDIVNSKNFANLMPESGIDCTIGRICSEETKKKISMANKGRIPSKESIEKAKNNRKIKVGFRHTEETRKKLSDLRKGKKLSAETIQKMVAKTKGSRLSAHFKKVYQYGLSGEFIKSFPSIVDAINECPGDIYNAVSGRHKTAGGYQWRLERFDGIEPYYESLSRIEKSKTVYQYDKHGNFIKEWQGTKQPSEALNINRGAIRNCLSGISKSAGNYVWKYMPQ